MWAFTCLTMIYISALQLWIDFKLYFYVSIHMKMSELKEEVHVVNWFQIVFLCEHSHVNGGQVDGWDGCELISNCIFMWAFTCNTENFPNYLRLWIDFKLYFYVSIHMIVIVRCFGYIVVNWFQIVFLCEHSHVGIYPGCHP